MKRLSCAEAKQIDLVEYLAALGIQPQKIRNGDYWYSSPFRKESTPSFKVNRTRNMWFDFGEGMGGDVIAFGARYFKCSVSRLLELLSEYVWIRSFSFHPQKTSPANKPYQTPEKPSSSGGNELHHIGRILILSEEPLVSPGLLQYLDKRCIPLGIAHTFLREVAFSLYNKTYKAIGFRNNKGGFELRNEQFKGSSSPKASTFIDQGSRTLTVFEGFFDYLSFQALGGSCKSPNTNFLVLNSLAFFHGAKDLMDRHQKVNLYLDRDHQGRTYTRQALSWDRTKYKNQSTSFRGAKDLNDWLVQSKIPGSPNLLTTSPRHYPGKGRGI